MDPRGVGEHTPVTGDTSLVFISAARPCTYVMLDAVVDAALPAFSMVTSRHEITYTHVRLSINLLPRARSAGWIRLGKEIYSLDNSLSCIHVVPLCLSQKWSV